MDKKAQGISLNVIIIAAIALLVLVILSVIFMNRIGIFSEKSKDCEAQSGKCFDDCATTGAAAGYPKEYSAWACTGTNVGKQCCIAAG